MRSSVQRYRADWEGEPWMEARRAETDEGAVFLLDTAVWERLTSALRRGWLLDFVQQQQPPYPTIALQSVPSPIVGSVRLLANTFAAHSGPNCFATMLAPVSEQEAAETIGAQWLHAALFLDGIAAQGYRPQPGMTGSPLLRDAILLWCDAQCAPQHACYLIGDGIVLNKNSQAWYHPRELAALADVLAYWSDEPLELVVYTRAEAGRT